MVNEILDSVVKEAVKTNDQKVNMYDFISNFEDAKKKKKVTKKSSTIEMFMTT